MASGFWSRRYVPPVRLVFQGKCHQTRCPELLVVAGKPVHQVHPTGPSKPARHVEAFEEVRGRWSGCYGFVAERDGRRRAFAEMVEARFEGEERVCGAVCVRKDAKPTIRFGERDKQPAGTEGPLIERVCPHLRSHVIEIGLRHGDEPLDNDQRLRHGWTVLAGASAGSQDDHLCR